MKPGETMSAGGLIFGDCLQELPKLGDKSIDFSFSNIISEAAFSFSGNI